MFNLISLKNTVLPLYLFIYLIFPYSAITQTKKFDFRRNLENALNNRDFEFIKESFENDKNLIFAKKFSRIIKDFPNSKWKIGTTNSVNPSEESFQIKVIGKRIVDGDVYNLESNFNYLFSRVNGKITKGAINKLFTIIRNDNKKIDITFKIPDEVLTGAKYDIDIILNKPLEDVIVAGGIKLHQWESFIEQEIVLEPLVAGGIFKMTRAPSKPGIQVWSGMLAHPKGIITFTKSINIVEKI